jgi:hypothetical protein
MRWTRCQEVDVTLSAATFSRLERGNPFKRRVNDQAIEAIRAAVFTIFPPRTPEEWKDRNRYQGTLRTILLWSYDMICYLVRKLIGKDEGLGRNANQVSQEPVQITLKIPTGLMSWIEKIARANQSTIPEARSMQSSTDFACLIPKVRTELKVCAKRGVISFR